MKNSWLKLVSIDVRKRWLHFTAGILWFGVGIMLIGFASRWLKLEKISTIELLVLAGLVLAAGIYSFGFSKIARKNIHRINGIAYEKVSLFAFQSWTSYPLVAFMIALGIYLRMYSPVPKSLLAILYMGIGGGLLSSSLHYFTHFVRLLQPEVAQCSGGQAAQGESGAAHYPIHSVQARIVHAPLFSLGDAQTEMLTDTGGDR